MSTVTKTELESLQQFAGEMLDHGYFGKIENNEHYSGSSLNLIIFQDREVGQPLLSVRIVRHMNKDLFRVFPIFQKEADQYDIRDTGIDSIYISIKKAKIFAEVERRLLRDFLPALVKVQERIDEHKIFTDGKEATKKRIENLLGGIGDYDGKFQNGSDVMQRPTMRNVHRIQVPSKDSVYLDLRYLTADGAIKLLEFLKETGIGESQEV